VSARWACLLGQPVAQSLSPTLHNAAFRAAGIDAQYGLCETAPAELGAAVERLRSPLCLGANVTAPHKRAVLALLDDISEAARALGAVNTIVPTPGGRLYGDNTDADGLARWLRLEGIDAGGRPALVLGAGGAARAAVWALAELGAAHVRVLNRTPERASELVAALAPYLPATRLGGGELALAAQPAAEACAVVINATSLGHHGSAPSVDPSWYSPGSVGVELVYNPPLTGFMQAAQAAGARVENGLGMLIHQAALAFECWTGQPAPLDAYTAAAAGAARDTVRA
jgi:shikimate dehydrogenase